MAGSENKAHTLGVETGTAAVLTTSVEKVHTYWAFRMPEARPNILNIMKNQADVHCLP